MAEQGVAEAQFVLASIYLESEDVQRDYKKAAFWAEKAAEQDHQDAQAMIGYLYFRDEYGIRNNEKAAYWFEKIADTNHPFHKEAQFALGILYKLDGSQKNYPKAKKYLIKTTLENPKLIQVAAAQMLIGDLYLAGYGVRQSNYTAKEWYGKSCDNGYQKGCDNYRVLKSYIQKYP